MSSRLRMVLLNPPFPYYASSQPPLGLAYLAAVSKMEGVDVKIIDAHAERLSLKEITGRILEYKPELLGITMSTPVFDLSVKISKAVKREISVFILVGGPHPSTLPEETLGSGAIDVVCRGEGEETLAEVFDYFLKEKPLEKILGISFLNKGESVSTPDRPPIKNLDDLPFPCWDGFPLDRYFSPARKMRLSLPIMTSRGCPAKCYFCYKGIFGSQYRFRSPRNVVNEIVYLKNRYHLQEFSIIDDNFSLLNKRSEEICNLIIERRLNLPWSLPNGIRASPLSENLFRLMKKSGCYRVFVGVETGDEQVLKSINKGISLKEVEEAVRLARKAGLEVGTFFMIGNLGEDAETIDKTIAFSLHLNPDFSQFTIATPYPGTVFYETIKREGKFLFEKWGELGTYEKAVFEHGNLTADLINRKFREAYRKFYLRPNFIIRKIKGIKRLKDIKNLLSLFSIFIKLETKKSI